MDEKQNIVLEKEWCNAVGGFGGGAMFVFKLYGRFGVALVGFVVDGDLKFG